MESEIRALRSILFTPGNDARKLEKVGTFGADAVALDLEDAVLYSDKEEARVMARESIARAGSDGSEVFVRINNSLSDLAEKDLHEVVVDGLSGILIPKVGSPRQISEIDSVIEKLEINRGIEQGSIKLLPTLETAQGILEAYSIASSSPRVLALVLGAEDLTMDIGVERTVEGIEIAHAREHIVLSAAAAHVQAIDSVYVDFRNIEGLVKDASLGRRLGYKGKLLIHPGQVEPVNNIFTPTKEEVDYARRIVEAYNNSSQEGYGVAVLDGKMLDSPVVKRARKLLDLYEEILRRSS